MHNSHNCTSMWKSFEWILRCRNPIIDVLRVILKFEQISTKISKSAMHIRSYTLSIVWNTFWRRPKKNITHRYLLYIIIFVLLVRICSLYICCLSSVLITSYNFQKREVGKKQNTHPQHSMIRSFCFKVYWEKQKKIHRTHVYCKVIGFRG